MISMDEISYLKAFEYVGLIAESTHQNQSVIKKALGVLYDHKIKDAEAGTKLQMMIFKINQDNKLEEVFSLIKTYADCRSLSRKEIQKTIKSIFGNYASDAAMILFNNIDEWIK